MAKCCWIHAEGLCFGHVAESQHVKVENAQGQKSAAAKYRVANFEGMTSKRTSKKMLVPFLQEITLLNKQQLTDMSVQRLRIIAQEMNPAKQKSLPKYWKEMPKENLFEMYSEMFEPEIYPETYMKVTRKMMISEIEEADEKERKNLERLRIEALRLCPQCRTPCIWSTILNTWACSATMDIGVEALVRRQVIVELPSDEALTTKKAKWDKAACSPTSGTVELPSEDTPATKKAKKVQAASSPTSGTVELPSEDKPATKKAKKEPTSMKSRPWLSKKHKAFPIGFRTVSYRKAIFEQRWRWVHWSYRTGSKAGSHKRWSMDWQSRRSESSLCSASVINSRGQASIIRTLCGVIWSSKLHMSQL